MDITYWDKRYEQNDTTWDTGIITTPIKEYIDQLTDKSLRIIIPGCGNGYEAVYLAESGFTDITVIDISSVLTDALRNKFSAGTAANIKIIQGDFFELEGEYDLMLEQTFFCALSPELRKNYVQKSFEILSKNGKLTGLLFNREFEGGPPFGGNKLEYLELFSPLFDIRIMEPCYNSIKPRAGAELFVQLNRKSK